VRFALRGEARCFFDASLENRCDTRRHVVTAGLRSAKNFRTINVQWIGQWGLFSRYGFPRINKLRVINGLDSPTPAASTTYLSNSRPRNLSLNQSFLRCIDLVNKLSPSCCSKNMAK
jgi:hypothetical protein